MNEPRERASQSRTFWVVGLLLAICMEGWGRKVLPFIPGAVFYELKDLVLLGALARFGISPDVKALMRGMVGKGMPLIGAALLWTLADVFNPEQSDPMIPIVGMRAYWLWLLVAPGVVATLLRREGDRQRLILALAAFAIAATALATLQFRSSAHSDINQYTNQGLHQRNAYVAVVGSTGRVRVMSFFSYITGFADFVTLAPMLLLAAGLTLKGWRQVLVLGGVLAVAIGAPMTGSRGPVVNLVIGLVVILWTAGVLRTRVGRRSLVAVGLALLAAFSLSGDAVKGVTDRFANAGETEGRFAASVELIPFAAPFVVEERLLTLVGAGTGAHQNFAVLSAGLGGAHEAEPGRILGELGIPGFFLLSLVRMMLLRGLWRCASILLRGGESGIAGLARVLCIFGVIGTLVLDHVYQALYFLLTGYVLASVLSMQARVAAQRRRATS